MGEAIASVGQGRSSCPKVKVSWFGAKIAGRFSAKMECYPLVVLPLRFLPADHAKAVATRHAGVRGTIGDVPTDILICGMLQLWGAFLARLPLHGENSSEYESRRTPPVVGSSCSATERQRR